VKKLIFLSMVLSSASVLAGNIIQFQANTPAKAAEVNANFSELETRIQTNFAAVSNISLPVSLWKNIGSDIYYTGGNVGIGTNSPSSVLDVKSKGKSLVQVIGDLGLHVDSDRLLRIGAQDLAMEGGHLELKGAGQYQDWVIDTRKGDLRFFEPFPSRTSVKMRGGINFHTNSSKNAVSTTQLSMKITSSGNVGIGVASPVSKLAVAGLPTSPPDTSGNAGIVCATNNGNFWLDNDGVADCL